jgi:hypothetical protein
MAHPNPQATSQHSPRTGSQDGSLADRRKQEAESARKKADDRRRQMSGAAGWVASRAGDWSLDERDPQLMELQKYVWNPREASSAGWTRWRGGAGCRCLADARSIPP